MLSCFYKDNSQRDNNYNDITKKEKALYAREKELIKKEVILQRKIKEYEKRANCKAKADLKAAAKLRQARKKLLFALDSRDKLRECRVHNCKGKRYQERINHVRTDGKGKHEKEDPFTNVVLNFCEKLLSHPCVENNIFKSIIDTKCFRPYERHPNGYDSRRVVSHKASDWNLAAGDCYFKSLHRTPPVWAHYRWPQFHLNVRKQWKNLGHLMLFIAGFLIWVPMCLCLEFCKCCFCASCCDF